MCKTAKNTDLLGPHDTGGDRSAKVVLKNLQLSPRVRQTTDSVAANI